MKKLIAIVLLICTLALCLASCGKKKNDDENNNNNNNNNNNSGTYTPPPKTDKENAEDLIAAITDADTCYAAARAFYALSKEDRESIYSSYQLENQMKTYADDSRIRDILMKVDAEDESESFHFRLRNKLLNINSYTVNNQTTVVFYDADTNNYYLYIKIDYSAQNQLGGYVRYENNADYYVWKNEHWVTLPYSTAADRDLVEDIYTWQFEEYTRYYFTYVPQ